MIIDKGLQSQVTFPDLFNVLHEVGFTIGAMVKLEEVFSEDEEEVQSEGEEEEEVLLGFVDEAENAESLERHFFPSKVGGVPAWLDPVRLPQGGATVCGFCVKPLAFLMQVYGPLESEPSAFHRTIFVFVCKSNTCLKRHFRQQEALDRKQSVRVFRCQLPRSNPLYSFHPANPGTLPPAGPAAPLCDWCGAWEATKRCGGCRDHAYCSKDHQVEHWRAGHSTACKRLDKQAPSAQGSSDEGLSARISPNADEGPSAESRPNATRSDAEEGPALRDPSNSGNGLLGTSEASDLSRPSGCTSAERDASATGASEAGSVPPSGRGAMDSLLGADDKRNATSSAAENQTSAREEMGRHAREGSGGSTGLEGVSERGGGSGAAAGEDVMERVGSLSVDDAGFPVSLVDWEGGTEPRIGSSSTLEPGKNGTQAEEGRGEAGVASREAGRDKGTQPTGRQDVSGDSGGQGDVSGGAGPQHSGADVSGAAPSGRMQVEPESALESGAAVKENEEKTGGRPGKGGTAELTAVVKPRALDPKLWPELEIAVESEADYQGESETGVSGRVNGGLGDVSALLEQYGRRVEKKREFSEADLEEAEAGMRDMGGDKKQWAAFEARLAAAPEQVLRYCRSPDAKPLWPSSDHRPSEKSIPPCPDCGSERIFEFQVLPQLLYYMHVDSSDPETLDWGTIAVYTCGKSCKGKEAYQEEVVWLQVP